MPKLDQQITALQEKLKALKIRQQRADARRTALETHRARKIETRKKILIGGVVLEKLKSGEMEDAVLRQWLDAALVRRDDRELFGLPMRLEDAD